MINLKFAIDQEILIQFKHGIYVVAVAQGHFVPLSGGTQDAPGAPIVVDRLEGRLREQDGQPILTYQNPANPSEQVDIAIDPENISCVWIARKIQVAPQIVMPR